MYENACFNRMWNSHVRHVPLPMNLMKKTGRLQDLRIFHFPRFLKKGTLQILLSTNFRTIRALVPRVSGGGARV